MTAPIRSAASPPAEALRAVRTVAVIDIGATAIRMAIAEIHPDGKVKPLESLSQEVNLGKDVFTRGSIRKETVEQCVQVLKSYRKKLQEYRIASPDQMRVVATSAVREAENRLTFGDRVFIATGIEVEPTDEAEISRITFLGIEPFLKSEPALANGRVAVVEVGGGTTELLMVHDGDVAHSRTYRLGAQRLRATLAAFRAPAEAERTIIENQIAYVMEQIQQDVPAEGPIEMIGLGGDMRFAARQLVPDWRPQSLARIGTPALERLANKLLAMSEDDIVRQYRLTYPDAATIGPALLSNVRLANLFQIERIFVSNVNLRDGLLNDMAVRGAWTEEFKRQVVRSAMALCQKYDVDVAHARHVADLTRTLFQALAEEHQLDSHYELILYLGAMLHEIGMFVSPRAHHKHTMYLINNSELFGMSKSDLMLVALVARYHRRASPKPIHDGYATLDRESRIAVAKMASLMRVADALDGSRSQRVREIRCEVKGGQLIITVPHVEDLALERLALSQKGPLFEEVFGMPVQLRRGRG